MQNLFFDSVYFTDFVISFRLVDKINRSVGQDLNSQVKIGVLDIYGFECFKNNRWQFTYLDLVWRLFLVTFKAPLEYILIYWMQSMLSDWHGLLNLL